MAFIYPMCSSSKGNCTYVGNQDEGVLIDAGLGIRGFLKHLSLIGVEKQAIRGIFVTHEHSDHVKGLARIQKELDVPVYASNRTLSKLAEKGFLWEEGFIQSIDSQPQQAGGFVVEAFSTPHDSVESQAYQIHIAGGKTVTVCTDLGHVTSEIHERLASSDLLLLESNYDPAMLEMGPYPEFLKRRIAGSRGHLSNTDCGYEITRLYEEGVRHFVLGHLSEENNRPELAYANVVSYLQQAGAQVQKDFTLWVAPKNNEGQVVPVL